MERMEILGNTFLMVIDPLDFDIKQQKAIYPEFGFVIASESRYFRSSVVRFCEKYHEVRRGISRPTILTSIQKGLKEFDVKSFKKEREFLELVALFFDISFYTAISQDKKVYLREFTMNWGDSTAYFGYIGSRVYNNLQLIEKIRSKIERSRTEHGEGSFIEVSQIFN